MTTATITRSRFLRSLALCAGIVLAGRAASAQNECTALGLRTIGFMNSDGVEHQVLCWDKHKSQSCSPSPASCTSAVAEQPPVSAPSVAVPVAPSNPVVTNIAAPLPAPTPIVTRVAFASGPAADELPSPPLQ